MTRVKMLCNWQSSYDLCKEWSNMCDNGFFYKDIEITWEDNNIDYYVIINFPRENEFYIPEKTIIFQMEPSVAICHWGAWGSPDENKFMFVGNHKKHLNAVQLQIRTIPSVFPENRKNKVLSILSSQNCYKGHKKRIKFIRKIEEKRINLVHVYGKENFHNFKNYKGQVIDDSKEKCFSLYKYCFQAENNSEYNYATEKIWEAICCECLCFYWGCPNLDDYIDPLSFVRLDLNNFQESLNTMKRAIEEDWWSQRIAIIRKEKEKIINHLGFFPNLKNIISKSGKI